LTAAQGHYQARDRAAAARDGFADLRYDAMGNLIATDGTGTSGKSLMFIGNAINQPTATMPNPNNGDVVDGAPYDLPGECVMGKGTSEQKANLAVFLHAMETVIASGVRIAGTLIFQCCLSGETSAVMLGTAAETHYSPAAFDQGYLNHVGIPTANFGAGENQWAHTDFDMASVERTTDSARVYAFMMLTYLS
jgi:acetylornithine deacetylase/succinyl-diaminopimelate desuccinylase-like protein